MEKYDKGLQIGLILNSWYKLMEQHLVSFDF